MHQTNSPHVPVLLDEVLQYLSPEPGDAYLDLTAGYGGHAEAILERTDNTATLVDRDESAINHLKKLFDGKPIEFLHDDFYSAAIELKGQGRQYNVILADLGVSSPHLDNASRGFSIGQDGPLDMRMDPRQVLTAAQLLADSSEKVLTRILKRYGEEPKARSIARLVKERSPKTTKELASLVASVWPGKSKTHPATRTFQALRIAVNDELGLLERALPIWLDLLAPGGRIAVISFHSLEDRIVKRFLAEYAGDRYDAELSLLTKGAVQMGAQESVINPRARSAKLRAAVKIKK